MSVMLDERTKQGREPEEGTGPGPVARYLPIALLVAGAGVAWYLFGDYLSFETLANNREALIEWRDGNWALAAAAYIGVYVLIVAFSIPGAVWVTLGGGFLFGTLWGGAMTIFAATAGAVIIFLAAKGSLGRLLHRKAGPWLRRVEDEFAAGEISFLLVIRLVPVMPFFIANLLPAFLNAKFRNYLWTTVVGIAPGTLVFTSIGAGLSTEIADGQPPDLGVMLEPHVLGPLLGLALLALIPVAVRKLRNRGA